MAESFRSRIKEAASHEELVEVDSMQPDLGLNLDQHKNFYEIESLRQQRQETIDIHRLRVEYTGKIFVLVCAWLTCVIVCIVLSGFKLGAFSLSDSVLIAFITSTTVNVVGLFIVVAKWMFPAILKAKQLEISLPKPVRSRKKPSIED